MKIIIRILALSAAALGCTPQHPSPAPGSPAPVVVELFTSDGCSSCPPADAVFSGLVQRQPVAGAQVIALGLHVDYWDQLGWKDPASLALATARQQAYGRVWGPDRVYTPQVVVDGAAEMVGSDEAAVRSAIARAAAQPHARVSETALAAASAITVDVRVEGVPASAHEPLDAVVFVTEDGLTSNVTFGENAGRTLHHDAVVRAMYPLGRVSGGMPLHARAVLPPQWHRDRVHIVALVQGRTTSRIWGAASTALQ